MINTWKDKAWPTISRALAKSDWSNFRNIKGGTQQIEGGMEHGRVHWKAICINAGIPPNLCKDSLIGNPKPPILYEFKGVQVTKNSLRQAYHIHRIEKRFNPTGPIRVLEIGAGYGGFAEQFCRKYEVSRYHLIDIPLMQALQGYYMIKAGYANIISFELPAEQVDLIVTTQTLGEMPIRDVTKYIKLIEKVIKPETGLFYSVQSIKAEGFTLTSLKDYPFNSNWIFQSEPYVRSRQSEFFGRYHPKS